MFISKSDVWRVEAGVVESFDEAALVVLDEVDRVFRLGGGFATVRREDRFFFDMNPLRRDGMPSGALADDGDYATWKCHGR